MIPKQPSLKQPVLEIPSGIDRLPSVLATDLDGTLIPLEGQPQQALDLRTIEAELSRRGMALMFVTGRHLASIMTAIETAQLPLPGWIVADVGTSIYRRSPPAHAKSQQPHEGHQQYQLLVEYSAHLQQVVGQFTVARLAQSLGELQSLKSLATLRLQEPVNQGPFKLSYYIDDGQLQAGQAAIAARLKELQAPYNIIASSDPFNGDGLIDLLPKQVSKAHAITWWATQQKIERDDIIFAGDSGNDSAVFAAGFRSIIVGNAASDVLQAARSAHAEAGWNNRIYAATEQATSGVLAGLRHFCVRN